ncbi:hypothetical protein MRX96_002309 [Rhipicephalus microplus]
MVLGSAADKRLSQLAELADSVLAVAPPSLAALQPDNTGCAPTTAQHVIREQISRLADTVAAMQARRTPEERQSPAAPQRIGCYHRKHDNAACNTFLLATMRETEVACTEDDQCPYTPQVLLPSARELLTSVHSCGCLTA